MFRFLNVQGAVAILAARARILTPWAPRVIFQSFVQIARRFTCKLNYKVAILATQGANLEILGANGDSTKACSAFWVFLVRCQS